MEAPVLKLNISCVTGKCYMPLGIQDKRIPDENFRASTFYDVTNTKPSQSRLKNYEYATAYYGWRAKVFNTRQWLQVDLGKLTRVTGVATQDLRGHNYWVVRYTISYSTNGKVFRRYKAYGKEKVRSF